MYKRTSSSTQIARVFPRKTSASPTDPLAFFGDPPDLKDIDVDEVHVSVTFTWDIPRARELAEKWVHVAPVKLGGPAFGDPSGAFVPGKYLAEGYIITSRGCPNKCWFCSVWKREPKLKELSIRNGHIVQDDNLFACSEAHVDAVFRMLARQPEKAKLQGVEAALLTPALVDKIWALRPSQIFCAYDTPEDLEPLIYAGRLLRYADFTRSHLQCYVLIGYKGDTFEHAERRMRQAWAAGFIPFAMLWRNDKGETKPEWRSLQKTWARPASVRAVMKNTTKDWF